MSVRTAPTVAAVADVVRMLRRDARSVSGGSTVGLLLLLRRDIRVVVESKPHSVQDALGDLRALGRALGYDVGPATARRVAELADAIEEQLEVRQRLIEDINDWFQGLAAQEGDPVFKIADRVEALVGNPVSAPPVSPQPE